MRSAIFVDDATGVNVQQIVDFLHTNGHEIRCKTGDTVAEACTVEGSPIEARTIDQLKATTELTVVIGAAVPPDAQTLYKPTWRVDAATYNHFADQGAFSP